MGDPVPMEWGVPTATPGVYALGGGDWVITWSPAQVHPYAAQWIAWSQRYGPNPRTSPPQDFWSYGLQTKDIS